MTELPDFVGDSYKSMPPSSGFEVLAEHVCLIAEINCLREGVKSLKDLNFVTSGVVDMKEEIHIKCMLMQDMSRGLVTGDGKADRSKRGKLELVADKKRENAYRNGSSSENVYRKQYRLVRMYRKQELRNQLNLKIIRATLMLLKRKK